MLSTDGIHGVIPEKLLISMATDTRKNLGQCVEDMAMTIDNEGIKNGGGHDNLTVAMIELSANSNKKVKMSKRIKLIFLALLVICLSSLMLNMCQAFSPQKWSEQLEMELSEQQDSIEFEKMKSEAIDSINNIKYKRNK